MSLTASLAARAVAMAGAPLERESAAVARQCVVDAIGVGFAALDDPELESLRNEVLETGGSEQAALFGGERRVPVAAAALYNGTAVHLLDYDDVNLAITGHATAVVLPVLLALAQHRTIGFSRVLQALAAGTDVACRLGRALAPDHYARGFHATATTGAIGAAAAGACLLGLNVEQVQSAMAIAATQAAGLRATFGTFLKPLHAGLSARDALLATSLAERGIQGPPDIVGHPQGLAALSDSMNSAAIDIEPARGTYIRESLFKFSPSCFGTAAPIEAARQMRAQLDLGRLEKRSFRLTVNPSQKTICNIESPTTGAELRFSMKATVAMTLAGYDMPRLDIFEAATAGDPAVQSFMQRIRVGFDERVAQMAAVLTIDGDLDETRLFTHDAGVASNDLDEQRDRVHRKFRALLADRPADSLDRWLEAIEHEVDDVLSVPRLAPLAPSR